MITINSLSQFVIRHSPKGYVPIHTRAEFNFSNLVNALGCSSKLRNGIKTLNFSSMNQYGDRSCRQLKQKIALWLHVSVNQITIGNGSDEIIDRIPQVFLNPKDKVLLQTPTFFRCIEASHKVGGIVIPVNTKENEKFACTQDFCNRMIQSIKKHTPKIIWLCSPCNPTGTVMPLNIIETIIKATNGLVVIDEVYQELFDPENRLSAIRLIAKHRNILVLKSFSKAFGLAGIRVGFAVADKHIIALLEKLRLNFHVSTLSQKIAELALTDTEFLKQSSRFFAQERKWLFSEIHMLDNIIIGTESKTNVFIIKHKKKDLFKELIRQHITTADFRQANGLEGKGFVRVTIKTHQENEILLKALTKINNSVL